MTNSVKASLPRPEATNVRIVGRSSSHFTRVARVFAHELGVEHELVPIYDMTQLDPQVYAGNPALKLPILRRGDAQLFGTENICRALAELAGQSEHVLWPERLTHDSLRNAQELVWHGMAAEVQLITGVMVGKLPAGHPYFAKIRAGFEGALKWLDGALPAVERALPAERQLCLLEVTLFCLVEHVAFRGTLPLEPYPALLRFTNGFGARPSARQTPYGLDLPPA